MTASISYGWAQPSVVQLCKLDPLNISFCLEADLPTRQYVVLAIRGFELGHGGQTSLSRLAHDLSRLPRRQVVRNLWGTDPGNLNILKKCSGRIFSRQFYDDLMAVASDPKRSAAIRHCDRLTPGLITAVKSADEDCLSNADAALFTKLGGADALCYLVNGAQRLRPDMERGLIVKSLKALQCPSEIDEWLYRLVEKNALPQPPWEGTNEIIPIRTVNELISVGREFRNCIPQCRWQGALKGERAYYHCHGRIPAIVCLVRDLIFDQWRVEEIRGRRNTRPRHRDFVKAFAAAGYPMLSDEVAFSIP